MSNTELTSVLFVILLFLGLAHLMGYVFVKLRQPRVVGEILAGVIMGPALMGRVPSVSHLVETVNHQ